MIPLLSACVVPGSSTPPTDPAYLPPVDEPVWADRPVHDLVTAWTFEVLLPAPVPATVTCTLASDPAEVHTRTVEDGRLVAVTLFGLLADETYDCTLEADDVTVRRSITTAPLPDWLPSWELTVEGDPWGDYVLLNHGTSIKGDRQAKLLIVDDEARLRWYGQVPYDAADLDASYLGDGRILYGGGYAAPPTVIDLLGEVLLEAPPSSTGRLYHHHAEELPSGEFLALTVATNGVGERSWDGFAIDVLDPSMIGRTWTWNSQRGVDEGWLEDDPAPDDDDPYHANSVSVIDDVVRVNLRNANEVVEIDRATGARRWTLGPGQDFALVDAAGAPASLSDWFYRPHAPEYDGDRFLFYDNGVGRPGGSWSRVVELTVDEAARTARVTWSYTEPGWYEPIWGDVDRLPDGDVMFVRAHCMTCIDDDQRTEIVVVDPATSTVVWRMSFLDANDAGYRATRIDGCTLFDNAAYCSP